VDAVDLAGAAQFLLAHKGKVSRGGQVGLGDLARLASGGGDQVRYTSQPSAAYLVRVPPVPKASSSGWAKTAINVRLLNLVHLFRILVGNRIIPVGLVYVNVNDIRPPGPSCNGPFLLSQIDPATLPPPDVI
jgi:hypothetical protein